MNLRMPSRKQRRRQSKLHRGSHTQQARTTTARNKIASVLHSFLPLMRFPKQCISKLFYARKSFISRMKLYAAVVLMFLISPIWTVELVEELTTDYRCRSCREKRLTIHPSINMSRATSALNDCRSGGADVHSSTQLEELCMHSLNLTISSHTQADSYNKAHAYHYPVQIGGGPKTYAAETSLYGEGMNCPDRDSRSTTPHDLYRESQVGFNCQIHSLNALLGKRLIDNTLVRDTIRATVATNPRAVLCGFIGPNGITDPGMNNFLGTCAQPNLFVNSISAHKIGKGMCKQDMLQRLPTGCDRFPLRLTKSGSGGDYRHAACVRYSYSDMHWYKIDSEDPGPKVLSSDEWLDLDGEIRLLYHGKCGTLVGGNAPAFCRRLDWRPGSIPAKN